MRRAQSSVSPCSTTFRIFAVLFGRSMDYQVFIISRLRDAYDRTGSTKAAVVEGVGRTGRLVTSAALILTSHSSP